MDIMGILCRKSAGREGMREPSIQGQERRGRDVAAALGMQVGPVWRESGSASRFRRPSRGERSAPLRALRALEAGEIQALWLPRVDRWSRQGAGSVLGIIEPADGIPRRLLFDRNDPENPGIALDSTNPRDREEIIRLAEAARRETEVLSERVRSTKRAQLENGEWVSPRAPYGLRVVARRVEIDIDDGETELYIERKLELDDSPGPNGRTHAETARYALYELPVNHGCTQRGAAHRLNLEGIPSPSGGTWSVGTYARMLRHPTYAGWQITSIDTGRSRKRIRYLNGLGRPVSVMVGPPLLTNDEQREAIAAVSRGGWDRRNGSGPLLRGLLVCAGCSGKMVGNAKRYACWRSQQGAPCPAPARVAATSVEGFVHERWEAKLVWSDPDSELINAIAERWRARERPEETAEHQRLRSELAEAERALERVWADRRAGLYEGPSDRFFRPMLADATAEAQRARDELNARMNADATAGATDISFLLDPEMCRDYWASADRPLRRDLLRLAIDRVVVRRAPRQGVPFDGPNRCTIEWAHSA